MDNKKMIEAMMMAKDKMPKEVASAKKEVKAVKGKKKPKKGKCKAN